MSCFLDSAWLSSRIVVIKSALMPPVYITWLMAYWWGSWNFGRRWEICDDKFPEELPFPEFDSFYCPGNLFDAWLYWALWVSGSRLFTILLCIFCFNVSLPRRAFILGTTWDDSGFLALWISSQFSLLVMTWLLLILLGDIVLSGSISTSWLSCRLFSFWFSPEFLAALTFVVKLAWAYCYLLWVSIALVTIFYGASTRVT